MKIAIIHDWLVTYAGAERVLEQMLQCYPEADLFSLVDFLPSGQRSFIQNKPVTTSFIQRLPWARKKYRSYLPLMPLAVEQFDLSAYDLILSSSHAVAKGVLTGPDQLHLCMCYSPIRYAWDLQHQYLRETGLDHGLKGFLAKPMLHYIRLWDLRTAPGVDAFVAISAYIARRIQKVYGRESTILYPPVAIDAFPLHAKKEDFYITTARMVPYKRVDLIVQAFAAMPDKRLLVIGDGPEMPKIRRLAGANVELLGAVDQVTLRHYLQRAKAFVFATEEDFGIAPIEAQACGTPVIAFGKGGARETILPINEEKGGHSAPTGLFFYEQTVPALQAAVQQFDTLAPRLTPSACRANAERFAPERFRAEFTAFVEAEWAAFQGRLAIGVTRR